MKSFLARFFLMLGNIVIGLSVLAPAGMLSQLADGLHVGIHDAGLLVTWGAVVLCVGSPLMAWLTTRMDRRLLLVGTLIVVAVAQGASALASSYGAVLALRLAMLAIAAIYTPQAAATVGLIVPEARRPSAIAFVFLGWSLAVAGGLPLITFLSAHFGWRAGFVVLGAVSAVIAVLVFATLPRGLAGKPLSLASFATIARNKRLMTILIVTMLQISGQLTVFVYLAPLLRRLIGADNLTVEGFFALFGVAALVGNIVATAVVTALGTEVTLALFLAATTLGLAMWTLGAALFAAAAVAIFFWGLGFAAVNSMQQARLAETAPDLASASIALNTSLVYVGQAVGSGIGGVLFARGAFTAMGTVGIAFMIAACGLAAVTWQRRRVVTATP
ncbi:MAG TPA: MFS transporter [Pseudolabrys sp.]|jgi:predicted MFS family arabinose efflux permease|uniref:MFS transporter n=1 Tax=Pseudolabrys sp. TaxID=1960880 RepID=UPI002DDD6253|nr:MFS transporter [Pseudolabrys sp.]HEV2628803.1 MFS transporter [Pseudolabrys sp.]